MNKLPKPTNNICESCGKDFSTKYSLKKHENKKIKCINLKCDRCNKMFKKKQDYIRHINKKNKCKEIKIHIESESNEIELRKSESNEIELRKLELKKLELELETKKLEHETKKLEHETKKLEVMVDIEQEKTKRKSISNMKIMNHKSFKEFNRFSPIAQFN